MSIKLRRWDEREQIRTVTEETKHCLIFSREIFYVTIVLCFNVLWLKAVNEITISQTGTSIEHLTTQIELVLPIFYHSTTAYFLAHRVCYNFFHRACWSEIMFVIYAATVFTFRPINIFYEAVCRTTKLNYLTVTRKWALFLQQACGY